MSSSYADLVEQFDRADALKEIDAPGALSAFEALLSVDPGTHKPSFPQVPQVPVRHFQTAFQTHSNTPSTLKPSTHPPPTPPHPNSSSPPLLSTLTQSGGGGSGGRRRCGGGGGGGGKEEFFSPSFGGSLSSLHPPPPHTQHTLPHTLPHTHSLSLSHTLSHTHSHSILMTHWFHSLSSWRLLCYVLSLANTRSLTLAR